MSAKNSLVVRVGASVLAAVMQAFTGFALGYTSLILIGTASHQWIVWLVLAGSVATVAVGAVASIWLQRRAKLITWPIWPVFVLAGFLGFFVLIVQTATGD